jgi:hypothetical protein
MSSTRTSVKSDNHARRLAKNPLPPRISEGFSLLCFRPSQVEMSQTKVLNWTVPKWSKQFVSGVRNGTDIKVSLRL